LAEWKVKHNFSPITTRFYTLLFACIKLHVRVFEFQTVVRLWVHLYFLYGSQNKQRLFPYIALTDWFL
jgi:hypothetical protein